MNTLEKLQARLQNGAIVERPYGQVKKPIPHIACNDGSVISVQASEMHYCKPRDNKGPYTHVEVWYCGEVPGWEEFGDGVTPYAYVPIEYVAAEIDRRGGISAILRMKHD